MHLDIHGGTACGSGHKGGLAVGAPLDVAVGLTVGELLDAPGGESSVLITSPVVRVGSRVGDALGEAVGLAGGSRLGDAVGEAVGLAVGEEVGELV